MRAKRAKKFSLACRHASPPCACQLEGALCMPTWSNGFHNTIFRVYGGIFDLSMVSGPDFDELFESAKNF